MFGFGVGATTLLNSNQVLYKNNTTVEEALNDLYTKSSIGNATASDILSGKKALVGGQEVTGNLSFTSLSGTVNVGAGSYSTLLNGYYNLSNYRIKCGTNSCSACNSCCTAKSASGSFTSSTSSTTKIVTGFRPSYITVTGNVSGGPINVYNSSVATDKAYNNSAGWQSMPVSSRANFYSIDSDGFTVAKDTSVHTLYWFAVG